MSAKVSVIVPIYNAEQYLSESIPSILNQTFSNLEILLINDGSTDRSLEICRDMAGVDSRIQIVDRKNGGVSAARNCGIEHATGDFITFVDADDFLFRDAVENMVNEIESDNVDAIRMTCEILENGQRRFEKTIDEGVFRGSEKRQIIESIVTGKLSAYSCLLMIRASRLSSDIRFDTSYQMMEDACFYIDLLNAITSFRISSTVTYRYQLHRSGTSHNPDKFPQNAADILNINRRFNRMLSGNAFLDNMNAVHAKIISDYALIIYQSSWDWNKLDQFVSYLHSLGYRDLIRRSNLNFIPIYNAILVIALGRGVMASTVAIRSVFLMKLIFRKVFPLE